MGLCYCFKFIEMELRLQTAVTMFTDWVLDRFLNTKNSNSWFSALLNEFSEGLFLFEIFLQKSLFHVSNLRVDPIYTYQFDSIVVLSEAGLMFQFRLLTNNFHHTYSQTLSSQKSSFICSMNPLKVMKNAFNFILKALFVLKILKFLS